MLSGGLGRSAKPAGGDPGPEAKTIFEYLQRRYAGRFADGQLRTIQGQSFPHLIYHLVLTYSNWESATVCFSESFESLCEGFQNAVWELGKVPQRHRTDRLSTAVNNGFFLPVHVLSRLFRRLFLELVEKAFADGQLQFFSTLEQLRDRQAFLGYLAPVRNREWVVYAKAPFGGPQQVLDYVGRYTHRVAISNNRLLDIENGRVQFRYKDYRDGSQQKTMTLSADEFIRRFLLHVLPDGFHRIRYYGVLGNRYRQQKLEQCRQLLGMVSRKETTAGEGTPEDYRDRYEALTGSSLWECPICHRGRMVVIGVIDPCSVQQVSIAHENQTGLRFCSP